MHEIDLLGKLLVVLAAAVIIVPLAQRLRLNAVLGYLAAGVLVGPHGLSLLQDSEGTRLLAEFGVVFLLFAIGLELSVDRLLAMRRYVLGLGNAQVAASCLVIGVVAMLLLDLGLGTAIVVGTALALSSTAIAVQILTEERILLSRAGRASLAVLLLQDLAVVPLLVLVPLLAGGDGAIAAALGLAAAKAVLAVAIIIVIGRAVLRPIFRHMALSRNPELFTAMVLLVACGTGWATHHAGLSMALGAFLAGLLLAGFEYRHQVEADIAPFRGLFLGLFFMTVGMMIDPEILLRQPVLLLVGVLGLVAVKAMLIYGLARSFRLPRDTAVRVAFLLAGAGEFGFVVFGLALSEGVIAEPVAQTLITLTALSMALTPLMNSVGRRLADRLRQGEMSRVVDLAAETADLTAHVIVAGFGRVGQTVATLLADASVPHVCLDLDAGRVAAARAAGSQVFYGNAAQLEVLEAAGVGSARAVVVTIDNHAVVEPIVHRLRRRYPRLEVVARARDLDHAEALMRAGATRVVPEAWEASLQLAAAVLGMAGRDAQTTRRAAETTLGSRYGGLGEQVPASPPADDAAPPTPPADRGGKGSEESGDAILNSSN